MIDLRGLVVFPTVVGSGLLDRTSGLSPFAHVPLGRGDRRLPACTGDRAPRRQPAQATSACAVGQQECHVHQVATTAVTKKPGRPIKEKCLIKKSRKAAAENDRMTLFVGGVPGRPASRA